MKHIVVYFHGYGSSAKTDKVERLKGCGFDVHAWDIDIDPRKSIEQLKVKIDNMLIDYKNHPVKIVFVGTSLGAWYATVLADIYNVDAVVVNPTHTPSTSLLRYGVPEEITIQYKNTVFNKNDTVILAKDDEIIDHNDRDFSEAKTVIYSETGGHRFNGKEFDIVAETIKSI